MASRFTSAAVVDFGPKVHEGLHTPSHEEIAAKEAQRLKEEEEKISPKAHAAKMGMFGPLTRETRPWQPVSRLCKRFGVKVPVQKPDELRDSANIGLREDEAQGQGTLTYERPSMDIFGVKVPVQKPDGFRDLANIGLGEDETQGQDTLTYERPSMDIFKAIFASADEDSETEKKEKKKEKKKERKEKKGVLVSFAMDEDDTDAVDQPKQSKDRPKKKRKDRKQDEGNEDEGMWVDKPPGEVPSVISIVHNTTTTTDTSVASKGRKRAIDFM